MRIRNFTKGLSVVILTAIVSSNSFAQPTSKSNDSKKDSAKFEIRIPNLTADQQAKIKSFKVQNQKEELTLQNELAEKNAHLKTLEFSDKPDKEAIYKTIDEVSVLQGKIMKLKVDLKLNIASVLNDEQKIYFFTHQKDTDGQGKKQEHSQGKRKTTGNPSTSSQTSGANTSKK